MVCYLMALNTPFVIHRLTMFWRGPSTLDACCRYKVVQYRVSTSNVSRRSRRVMMSVMSIKKQVTQALNSLSEAELQQVAEYVAFLRFRGRVAPLPAIDETQLATLYAEFADEDRVLAEEGLEEYRVHLHGEDTQ
jgi:hypothetical protein